MKNPFTNNEELLLYADYGTANYIRSLALNLYNESWNVPVGRLLRNADIQHLQIAFDMMAWYAEYGENDKEFMRIVGAIANEEYAQ